jgi:hypothetical protein
VAVKVKKIVADILQAMIFSLKAGRGINYQQPSNLLHDIPALNGRDYCVHIRTAAEYGGGMVRRVTKWKLTERRHCDVPAFSRIAWIQDNQFVA